MSAQKQMYNVTVLMSENELLAHYIRSECHLKMILDDMASLVSLRELEFRLALVRHCADYFEEAQQLIEKATQASRALLNIYQRRRLEDEWIVMPEERKTLAEVFRMADVVQFLLSRRENMTAIKRAKEELASKAMFGIV